MGQVTFVEHGGAVFQLLAYGLADSYPGEQRSAESTLNSFRVLDDPAVLAVEPFRLKVVRLNTPTTLADLARRMNSPTKIETLAVMNRRAPDEQIPAGSVVKMVVGKPLP